MFLEVSGCRPPSCSRIDSIFGPRLAPAFARVIASPSRPPLKTHCSQRRGDACCIPAHPVAVTGPSFSRPVVQCDRDLQAPATHSLARKMLDHNMNSRGIAYSRPVDLTNPVSLLPYPHCSTLLSQETLPPKSLFACIWSPLLDLGIVSS